MKQTLKDKIKHVLDMTYLPLSHGNYENTVDAIPLFQEEVEKLEGMKKHTSSEPDATGNPHGYEERMAYNKALDDIRTQLLKSLGE